MKAIKTENQEVVYIKTEKWFMRTLVNNQSIDEKQLEIDKKTYIDAIQWFKEWIVAAQWAMKKDEEQIKTYQEAIDRIEDIQKELKKATKAAK